MHNTEINEYCTFGLGQRTFAIRMEQLEQIAGQPDIYPFSSLSDVPKHIRGTISLKGQTTVPVVDLRMRVGLRPIVFTRFTCMLIVHVRQENGRQLVSLLVDRVIDNIKISALEMENVTKPKSPSVVGRFYLDGIILLDTDKVLSARTMAKLGKLCKWA